MRIKHLMFICGSLEPGRDGVGDYTRQLASEMIREGHQATVVSINDCFISEEYIGKQQNDDVSLQILRIPAVWDERKRYMRTKEFIDLMDPNWISIQFVIFSFASNGVPFLLARFINKITVNRLVHVMFHELWVGVERKDRIKFYILSFLQKAIIKHFLNLVSPAVVHTHLPLYKSKLERLGVEVNDLLLFSNIEINKSSNRPLIGNTLRVGFFSQVEMNDSIMSFLEKLVEQADLHHLTFEILLVGGAEARMKSFGNYVEQHLNLRNSVKYTGYLPAAELSDALQSCSLGITSVPVHALGKSGSVAAFIAHGIPVAAPISQTGCGSSKAVFFSDNLSTTILTEPDYGKLLEAKEKVMQAKQEICLSSIGKKFISDLTFYEYEMS